MSPPRVVFDAVTFLQVISSRTGPAAACWNRVLDGEMFHCASEATLSEAAEVLTRPTVLKRLKMTKARVEEFVESVRDNSTVLIAVPHRFNFPRDPDDEPLIDLAIEADAQFLVTWDKDLLDLMEPENADGQTLKAQAPNLRIVAPPELLRTLRAAQIPE